MKLYEKWFRSAYNNQGEINVKLWDDFMPVEQKVYEYILNERAEKIEGTISEIAKKFNMSEEYVVGFIDGINDTQNPRISIENLESDTKVCINIDLETLYKKMVEYKADHLYNLPQWKEIFTEEQLKMFYRNQKSSRTVVNAQKVGRNEPCPCKSGRKYKHCCGAN